MRAVGLVVRSFRNLADVTLELPEPGVALIGPNGQGKTNILEALAYPVLFRSVRGAADREVGRFGGPGFQAAVTTASGEHDRRDVFRAAAEAQADHDRRRRAGRRCRPPSASGSRWDSFPTDLALVQGGAAERRRWLDRMLSLADRGYLEALLRYRSALAQRNAALRAGDAAAADAFNPALAQAGARLTQRRRRWVEAAAEMWQAELATLGEQTAVALRYRGDEALDEPDAWDERLDASRATRSRTRPDACRAASRRPGARTGRPHVARLWLDRTAAHRGNCVATARTRDARGCEAGPSGAAGR